jgi:hypothetical protein
MVSGNGGGPVARKPATRGSVGGDAVAAAAWMRGKKKEGRRLGHTEGNRRHAWGADARAER